MNALEFLPFLGHSSIHLPFDDFLTNNGITKRPKINERLDTTIFVPGQGLSLAFRFDTYAKEEGFVPKSEGSLVFTSFTITLIAESKKNGQYSGPLPRGLVAADTRQTVEQKLGTPKRRNEESDNYFIDGLVWEVAFEGDKFQYLRFYLPTNGWRKHGICP